MSHYVVWQAETPAFRCWNTTPHVAPHPPLSAVCSVTRVLLRHFKLPCTQSHLPAFSLTDWTAASSLFRAKDRRMGGIWIELLNDLMDQCLSPAEREGLFVCWLQERSGKSFSTKAVTVGMSNIICYWCLNNLIPWVCPTPPTTKPDTFGSLFYFQYPPDGRKWKWWSLGSHNSLHQMPNIRKLQRYSVLRGVMKFGNLLKIVSLSYRESYVII